VAVARAAAPAGAATVAQSSFVNNQAVGGICGGNGLSGGLFNGGESAFGTNAPFALQMNVSNCTVTHNQAIGGAGSPGGNGGNGLGGGIFNDSGTNPTVIMTRTNVTANQATGGAAGTGGVDSQGIGGGIYTLGTFYVDAKSKVKGKKASTSDDDIFGTVILI
jgi:hypothetical protein